MLSGEAEVVVEFIWLQEAEARSWNGGDSG